MNQISSKQQCIDILESFNFPDNFIKKIMKNYSNAIKSTPEIICIDNRIVQFSFIIHVSEKQKEIIFPKQSGNLFSALQFPFTIEQLGFDNSEQLYNKLLEVKTFMEIVYG